jgi:hypothetical protein
LEAPTITEDRMAQTQSKRGSNHAASSTSSSLASKAKTPAIAGGAAVAGLVGGIALSRRAPGKKVLGVRLGGGGARAASESLADAAREIGTFGERVGELANEIRVVREGVSDRHARSPIEVVLEGLTTRRKRT